MMANARAGWPLQIVPVIDLLGGQVVRGVGGRRASYRPLVSPLCPTSEPLEAARRLLSASNSDQLYVADLDAIAGAPPDYDCYRELAELGVSLWVDAGVRSAAQAAPLAEAIDGSHSSGQVVVGLETLESLDAWRECRTLLGEQRLVFSLDLRGGHPLAALEPYRSVDPEHIAAAICRVGCRRMIVLDVADVGSGEGPSTLAICRQLSRQFPQLLLIAGGGIRGADDLKSLSQAGCGAALVSSWLHQLPSSASAGR